MVTGNRESDYGRPEENLEKIAAMWTVYLRGRLFGDVTARDVAAMLILLKVARILSGHAKDDNWVDIAGYAACGGEVDTGDEAVDKTNSAVKTVRLEEVQDDGTSE